MNEAPSFIEGMPKAELHLHLEGTLKPELKFELARRNGVGLPYGSVAEMRAAYGFRDLASFLPMHYEGMKVLLAKQDFYDLAMAYFRKVAVADAAGLTKQEVVQIASNAFTIAWIEEEERARYLQQVEAYADSSKP